jgi:Na+/H+ antiporter NhaA
LAANQDNAALSRFIAHEATGGMLLAVAALFAIFLVNAGFANAYLPASFHQ